MFRTSKQIVRMALLLMLFQFLSPAFIPLVVQDTPAEKATSYQVHHNSSVVAPMFLKEKDEKEFDEFFSVSDSTPLLDLTSHSFNLTASHEDKSSIFLEERSFLQPPRFTLFCTLLI